MLFVHYCSVYIYIYIHLDILIAFKIETPKHTMLTVSASRCHPRNGQFTGEPLRCVWIPPWLGNFYAPSGSFCTLGFSEKKMIPQKSLQVDRHSHHFSKWGHFSPLPPEPWQSHGRTAPRCRGDQRDPGQSTPQDLSVSRAGLRRARGWILHHLPGVRLRNSAGSRKMFCPDRNRTPEKYWKKWSFHEIYRLEIVASLSKMACL